VEKTCEVARSLGCRSVELVGPEGWPALKKHGLTCAIAPNGMPGAPFMKGFNNPRYHDEVITRTQKEIDGCAEAGFPAVIAFTVYHVQIMHGDLIRRLEQCKDVLGHVHTAGNPGRGELDDNQEINYPAVMKKLAALKYAGYVGQEFIPTRDALAGLRQAVRIC